MSCVWDLEMCACYHSHSLAGWVGWLVLFSKEIQASIWFTVNVCFILFRGENVPPFTLHFLEPHCFLTVHQNLPVNLK